MPGIYIHIPFCVKKCFYCDFYSVEKLTDKDKFLDYLIREIELRAKYEKSQTEIGIIDSVFFGGGTPSLLTPGQIERIIIKLKSTFSISDDAEWTVESNPGTLNLDSLNQYRKLGINRISIGVQSFVESELKFLQRIHDSDEAVNAISDAKKAGFDNRNVDLIFSIPGQTKKSLALTLEKIQQLKPEHISAYSLIYEKGTPLYEAYKKGQIKKIDDDADAELYEFLSEYLSNLGYEHYEVSNFALPGYKCRHNLNYWENGYYIGLGPSAHGYSKGRRYWNVKSLKKYYQMIDEDKIPETGSEILTRENEINERIMLGLRSQGIDFKKFKEEFDIDLKKIRNLLFNEWKINDLCDYNDKYIKLTHKGYFICNSLINQLVKNL
ncbi:MAG: radical SAM family heme chaperone HemW [bacterium]